jgi:hypothetical protein
MLITPGGTNPIPQHPTSTRKSSYSAHNTELDHLQIYLPSYLIVVTFAITWRAGCTFIFSKNNREGYLAPTLPSLLQKNPIFFLFH